MTLLPYLIARMKEASSYAGIVGLVLGALHLSASSDLVNAALGIVAAAGGLLAILIPEKTAGTGGGAGPAVAACLPFALVAALACGLSACAAPSAIPATAPMPGPATSASAPSGTAVAAAAATISGAVLPAADVQKLAAICSTAAPVLSAATSPLAPSGVSQTATYAAAYCGQFTAAAPQGQLPATTDSNTPSWLSQVLTTVEGVAQAAGYALPVVEALAPLL